MKKYLNLEPIKKKRPRLEAAFFWVSLARPWQVTLPVIARRMCIFFCENRGGVHNWFFFNAVRLLHLLKRVLLCFPS